MNLDTAKILAGSSAGLSVSGGISTAIMGYLHVNAAGIGALCTIITLFFYIFFQFIANKKLNQADKNLELIKELKKEISEISNKRIKG